ncbi:MAG TPA: proton-conducting transporter membrane subunit [Candidatus Omnitrophota bacterium]|nr:proton-conducting transporter membrane subunit [Candidatus Omnitrophota bacterium]HPD84902.1 proton-conducting transporter membrane subunit [Candidatus Omnitrophota bacterium]HRZ03760.1 proton-conducting transporter membrane subunit [Candidatus Omnitrophota bacterium]
MLGELFKVDNFSAFVGTFAAFFTVLIAVYSFGFMRGQKGLARYYLYIALTLISSLGAIFANNLVVFVVFWGFLGFLLYLLIEFGNKERTSATARKSLIIVGGTDAFMLLGVALIWLINGSFQMDELAITLDNKFAILAYLLLAIGAFAKAGAMPFHTWIPDMAEDAPTPVTAFLPASLDKLLGIYFLGRISLDIFQMNDAMNMFLMGVGSFTIVAAVMMALVQHDLKRLLGYHAVSQVGYMVLGIGTGNPLGIAGGIFHMLNHAIYKSCLFLSGGAVEKKAGTTDLEKLGGLVKVMPITFITFLIGSLAISGVPPFNGFASKWMIYQGIIELGKNGGGWWIVWLMAAMFGSALTLASFMKLVHAIFLGQPSNERAIAGNKKQEVGITMLFPAVLLAVFCIIFGVFAYAVPLTMFIFPSLNEGVAFDGVWNSGIATTLILLAIVLGAIIYFLGRMAKTRRTESFVGGEFLEKNADMRLSGVEFYNTIQDVGILKFIYRLAGKKLFDIYEVGGKIASGFTATLRFLHNGVLPTYLVWCLLGMLAIFYVVFK